MGRLSEQLQGGGRLKPQDQPKRTLIGSVGSAIKSSGSAIGKFLGETTGISGLSSVLRGKMEPIYKTGGLINPKTGGLQQPFNVSGAKQVVGTGAKLGLTAAALGTGAVARTALGRVAQGAGLGGGFGVAQGLEERQSAKDITRSGVIGVIAGAATAGFIEGGRWAVNKVPKLLSYVSDTPESVLQRNFDSPQAMKEASAYVSEKGSRAVLKDAQSAVKILRTNLSQQYEEGSKALIKLNNGKYVALDSKTQALLRKAANFFGIDLPQNMNKLSVNEALKLNVAINDVLRGGKLQESAEGVILRKAKESFGTVLKSKFTGVSEFLSNYAGEKTTLDAADMLVKAYKTNNPIAQRTALSRLLSVYNENAPSFLSAMRDLEMKTGVPIMDKIAALKSSRMSPASSMLKGETIISLIKSVFRTFADDLSRGAGRTSKFLQTKSPGASRVISGLGGSVVGGQVGQQ